MFSFESMTSLQQRNEILSQVLVTGGTGFLGAWILRRLVKDGYRVRAIRRQQSILPAFIEADILQQVEWLEGDVLDILSLEDAMEGVDAVIHAAAIVSFHRQDRRQMYATNVQGTANVVNMALEKNIRRIVHVSSVAALGRTKHNETVNEEKTWAETPDNTHYAISKHKAEMEVWRGMAEGLQGVIINPSTVLGYGNWDNSSCAIFKNAFHEFPWYTNGVNGFVYVEDVADAVVELMRTNINMQRFIINGDNWTFQKLFSTIADGFSKRPPYRKANRFLGSLAWRMEKIKAMVTGQKPLLTRETARVAQSNTRFDNRKITNTLPGFRFTSLEEAIQRSCQRYLQQHSR